MIRRITYAGVGGSHVWDEETGNALRTIAVAGASAVTNNVHWIAIPPAGRRSVFSASSPVDMLAVPQVGDAKVAPYISKPLELKYLHNTLGSA